MKKFSIVLALLVGFGSIAAVWYVPRLHKHQQYAASDGTFEARVPAFLLDQWKQTHPNTRIISVQESKVQRGLLLITYAE